MPDNRGQGDGDPGWDFTAKGPLHLPFFSPPFFLPPYPDVVARHDQWVEGLGKEGGNRGACAPVPRLTTGGEHQGQTKKVGGAGGSFPPCCWGGTHRPNLRGYPIWAKKGGGALADSKTRKQSFGSDYVDVRARICFPKGIRGDAGSGVVGQTKRVWRPARSYRAGEAPDGLMVIRPTGEIPVPQEGGPGMNKHGPEKRGPEGWDFGHRIARKKLHRTEPRGRLTAIFPGLWGAGGQKKRPGGGEEKKPIGAFSLDPGRDVENSFPGGGAGPRAGFGGGDPEGGSWGIPQFEKSLKWKGEDGCRGGG